MLRLSLALAGSGGAEDGNAQPHLLPLQRRRRTGAADCELSRSPARWLITGTLFDGPAEVVAYHAYQPFGAEVTDAGQDQEVMKFTGHERDLRSTPTQTADDLDYMHARSCSPLTGRFLSVDPVVQIRYSQARPQLWNRYAYALGNPLKFVDPSGERINLVLNFSDTTLTAQQRIAIARGLRARFLNAGVKDVRVHFKGGQFKGNVGFPRFCGH